MPILGLGELDARIYLGAKSNATILHIFISVKKVFNF